MTALDASVLIAYLRRADAHHERAIELVLDAGELVVHPITLAEVLVGAVGRGRGEELVETLRGLGVRQATVDAGQPLRLAELRAASALKLPDCCVLDLAITERTALATFDGALAEAARLHGVEVAGA